MEPDYAQLEFDTRLWLTGLEFEPPLVPAADPPTPPSS